MTEVTLPVQIMSGFLSLSILQPRTSRREGERERERERERRDFTHRKRRRRRRVVVSVWWEHVIGRKRRRGRGEN